jgi:hypothetical protein
VNPEVDAGEGINAARAIIDADETRLQEKENPRHPAGVDCDELAGAAPATAIRPTNGYMIAKNGDRSPDRIAAPLAATVGSAR